MPRHRDPDYDRTLTLRSSKGRLYASAKKLYVSDKDGKTKISDVYWGSLDKSDDVSSGYSYVFHPNNSFRLLSQKERDRFIYPADWNRVAKWQKIERTPAPADERLMTASYITRFTQSITEQNRSDLIRLRMRTIKDDDLVCIDSTTHSGYGGKRICEIDFGHNKDDKQLPCTVETMAYSLNSHMPVYYQTFQGNMVDVRTAELVMNELKELGFNNKVVSCTDRGYYCDDELQWHIKKGIGLISFAKVDSALISKHIPDISYTGAPYGMTVDPVEKIYKA